ncbi:MAG: hypothetical protein COB67_05515 [SAR324 cluster bacterium]|uniref:Uncharacterized protein n=1 Tax=SAR324 cluster bacterium TaxID=2024889 RepID=A0A2A4T5K5_9DELT|nr:MAG: hypothetical protein COB67_05515 [SAR324 cluster bacterium]
MSLNQDLKLGAYWNSLGFFIRFWIGLFSSILFVRLLGQEDYGIVTFILGCTSLGSILVNLGFGTIITKYIAEQRANGVKSQLFSLLYQTTLLRAGVIGIITVTLFFSKDLTAYFHKPFLAPYLYFIPLLLISTYFQGTFKTILSSYYEQKFINSCLILEMIIKLGLVLLALYWDLRIMGFLLAILLAELISGTQLLQRTRKKVFSVLQRSSTPFPLRSKLSLAGHAFGVTLSIRLLGRESDIFLLGILHHDIRQVAIYAVVFGLPNMTFELFRSALGGGLGLTIFTEQVEGHQIQALRATYKKILHLFSIFLFPTMIGGILVGGDLATLMYGSEYQGLSLLIGILFFALGIASINAVLTDLLFALDRGKALMKLQLGAGISNLLINIMVIPQYGALGVAVTTALINTAFTLTGMLLVHKIIQPTYPFQSWFRYLLISLIMGGCVYFFPFAFYWKIIMGMLVYGLLFILQALCSEDRVWLALVWRWILEYRQKFFSLSS